MAASEPKFDALIVEASGISEPQQIAEAFDVPDDFGEEDGATEEDRKSAEELREASALLKKFARLDCTVSLVDALQYPRDAITSSASLKDVGQAAGPEDHRSLLYHVLNRYYS